MPKRFRNPITKHVLVIRKSLTAIDRSLARLLALENGAGRPTSADRDAKKHTLKLSTKRRAELKLQG